MTRGILKGFRKAAKVICVSNATRDEIIKLSPPERLTLISDLWDSIADTDLSTPAAQRGELERDQRRFSNRVFNRRILHAGTVP